MKAILKRILLGVIGAVTATGVLVVSAIGYVQFIEAGSVVEWREDFRPVEYAIVLGASVKQDGTPSDAGRPRHGSRRRVYGRQSTHATMTGTTVRFTSMKWKRWHASPVKRRAERRHCRRRTGYRTYERYKRATEKYEIKEAVVVTQRFHLSRALFLCSAFGMDVQGLPADRRTYQRIGFSSDATCSQVSRRSGTYTSGRQRVRWNEKMIGEGETFGMKSVTK